MGSEVIRLGQFWECAEVENEPGSLWLNEQAGILAGRYMVSQGKTNGGTLKTKGGNPGPENEGRTEKAKVIKEQSPAVRSAANQEHQKESA